MNYFPRVLLVLYLTCLSRLLKKKLSLGFYWGWGGFGRKGDGSFVLKVSCWDKINITRY